MTEELKPIDWRELDWVWRHLLGNYKWEKFGFPLISKVAENLITPDLVTVQPLQAPLINPLHPLQQSFFKLTYRKRNWWERFVFSLRGKKRKTTIR